jgi:hypothetical protein
LAAYAQAAKPPGRRFLDHRAVQIAFDQRLTFVSRVHAQHAQGVGFLLGRQLRPVFVEPDGKKTVHLPFPPPVS